MRTNTRARRKGVRQMLGCAAAAALVMAGTNARAAVIDFESLALANSLVNHHGSSYSEDGFTLNQTGSTSFPFATFGTLESRFTGSTALFNDSIGGGIELVKDGGGAFTLNSIDLAELNGSGSGDVTFIGSLLLGGTVEQTFTLDGIAFGAETFNFIGFVDVLSVAWSQSSPFHQFDNIVVDGGNVSVPEPASLALFGLALAGLGMSRRRKHA